MNEKCDIYSYFWDNNQEKPNWGNIRRINTKLTFRQKICSLYLLKDKQEGRNKLKNIISNKEYVKENGRILYLNFTDKKSECELSYLKNSVENISFPFDQANIPKHAYLIEISFKLKKPYISRDDEDFYIIDNPIVKDKVFKVPMVRASTWKGALRFAAIKVFEDWIFERLANSKIDKNKIFRERARILKLFGNEKDSQEKFLDRLCILGIKGKILLEEEREKEFEKIRQEFRKWLIKEKILLPKEKIESHEYFSRAGRLFFYPAFFDKISLDLITPLSRETRTPVKGRGPIYFEIIPKGAKGIFKLFYYPFDLVAKGELNKIENEMKDDLEFLSKALKKMFYEIGFSAKKSSGFGVIEKIEEENIKVHGFSSEKIKEIVLKELQQS